MDFKNFKNIIKSSKINKLEELEIEIGTTDTVAVNKFCSSLMSKIESWKCGIAVERFIGCDESIVLVTKDVDYGIVSELNVHELGGVAPLESLPVFTQTFTK